MKYSWVWKTNSRRKLRHPRVDSGLNTWQHTTHKIMDDLVLSPRVAKLAPRHLKCHVCGQLFRRDSWPGQTSLLPEGSSPFSSTTDSSSLSHNCQPWPLGAFCQLSSQAIIKFELKNIDVSNMPSQPNQSSNKKPTGEAPVDWQRHAPWTCPWQIRWCAWWSRSPSMHRRPLLVITPTSIKPCCGS